RQAKLGSVPRASCTQVSTETAHPRFHQAGPLYSVINLGMTTLRAILQGSRCRTGFCSPRSTCTDGKATPNRPIPIGPARGYQVLMPFYSELTYSTTNSHL